MATFHNVYGNTGSISLQPNSTNLLYGLATIVYTAGDFPAFLTIAPSGQVSFYQPGPPPDSLPGALDMVRGSITNFGGIQNLSSVGVRFLRGGDLANYGTINGDTFAVEQRVSATSLDVAITNAGLIVGPTAISLLGASTGTIVNAGSGGIYATGAGGKAINKTAGTLSLTNYGAIGGTISSAGGNDTVINNGSIAGNIDLGAGNDTFGGVGLLEGTVFGAGGDDTLTGGIYDDRLNGGADNDILDGGRGKDVMTGEGGNDTYYVDAGSDRVIEAIAGGADTVYASSSYVLRAGQEIENFAVNPDAEYANLAISLTGNEFANTLTGNAAANRLDGKGGADTMAGGDGDDVYYVDDAGDAIIEAANHGTDTVYTSISYTPAANVETLRAQGTADISLTGNELANTIIGNAGNNLIDGGAGADTMTGGAGDDIYIVDHVEDLVVEKANGGLDEVRSNVGFTLGTYVEALTLTGASAIDGTGNRFDNNVTGNDASNTLNGKGGFDTLAGGGGADTFVFASRLDAAANFATITDFQHGVDQIALDDAIFRRIGSGGDALDAAFFTTSAPTTKDQHILYDQATGVLSHDLDGIGVRPAIAFAQVTPGTVLDHIDFLIV